MNTMVTFPVTAAEIAMAFEAYGKPIPLGQSGNALYKARVKFDTLEFRDGFGKWRILPGQTFDKVIAVLRANLPSFNEQFFVCTTCGPDRQALRRCVNCGELFCKWCSDEHRYI